MIHSLILFLFQLYCQSHLVIKLFMFFMLQPCFSLIWFTGQGQFWCHCPPSCIPLQSPWDHWLAAEERWGGPRGLHWHRRPTRSLCSCQGRPAVSPTVTGARPKVRATWFCGSERIQNHVLSFCEVVCVPLCAQNLNAVELVIVQDSTRLSKCVFSITDNTLVLSLCDVHQY